MLLLSTQSCVSALCYSLKLSSHLRLYAAETKLCGRTQSRRCAQISMPSKAWSETLSEEDWKDCEWVHNALIPQRAALPGRTAVQSMHMSTRKCFKQQHTADYLL